MPVDNGATAFAGNSHLSDYDKSVPDTQDEIMVAHCPAGSIVAIHPLVLHSGSPNGSREPRRNIVIQWGIKGIPLTTSFKDTLTELTVPEAMKLFKN